MGRRKTGLLDDLASAPWPVGIIVGLFGFAAVAHGVPAWLASSSGVYGQMFATGNPLRPLAWGILAVSWLGAAMSFLGSRRRRRLLDAQTGLESIASTGWRDFERLVGEAYRRQGYQVEETGLGGSDGGIDLVLSRDGRRILVQCKQWRRGKLPVNVVREMYGLLAHHGADEVRIAALGGFTRDAEQFAQGKPIQLIEGPRLLQMIRAVQQDRDDVARATLPDPDAAPSQRSDVPGCPRCQAAMLRRTNRRDGTRFWGCSRFPACRGSL